MWDATQYLKFGRERARPFFDLVSAIDTRSARAVADLGCGPGALTASLLERWPEATIWGIDSSHEMIEHARHREIPGRLHFVEADVSTWTPPAPLDIIVSNACFHWIPDHAGLLRQLSGLLGTPATLAFQVPDSRGLPSHRLLDKLIASPTWAEHLTDVKRPRCESPASYVEILSRLGFTVEAWQTTYYHLLESVDAILEWLRGTTLRPILGVLDGPATERFENEYRTLLAEVYSQRPYGAVFPFTRTFVVARRGLDDGVGAR
jgi:trans-aconitate 2-methyltransferase